MRWCSRSAKADACARAARLLAIGVNEAGYREILGLQLGDSESERSWMDFFIWLKGRGLTGVDLVVSDHHGGLVNAVRLQFQGATWQRCQTHLSANVSDATPKALQDEVHRRVRAIFEAPDAETARILLAKFSADFQHSAPAAVATLERGFDDATAVLALPRPIASACAPPMASSGSTKKCAGANASSASSPTASPPCACWERCSWSRMRRGPPANATSR